MLREYIVMRNIKMSEYAELAKSSEKAASQGNSVLSYDIIDIHEDGSSEIGYMKFKLPFMDVRDMVFMNCDIDLQN